MGDNMAMKRRRYYLIYPSKQAIPFKDDRILQIMLFIYLAVFAILAVKPADYYQWWYLNLPSAAIISVIFVVNRRMRLSNLSYAAALIFMILCTVGAHYTYALCPVGEWMKGAFGFTRNNYDRVVSLAFGLLMSTPVMEIMFHRFRLKYIEACIITIFIILAFFSLSSLFQMFSAAVSVSRSQIILNEVQGYIWEMQKDTAMGFLGVCLNMGNCIIIKIKRNQRIHMVKLSK